MHLRLDVVKRQRADRRSYRCNHRAAELDLEGRSVRAHSCSCHILGCFVGDQHRHVQGDSSCHGRDGTLPESRDSLFRDDTLEGIKHILVVAALFRRQNCISLHSDESKIAGIAAEGTEGAGDEGGSGTLQRAQVLPTVLVHLDPLGKIKIDTETECSVNDLSEQGRVDAAVEFLGAALGIELLGNVNGRGGATALRSKLDLHFDHVDGLNACCGRARRESSDEEVEIKVKSAHC